MILLRVRANRTLQTQPHLSAWWGVCAGLVSDVLVFPLWSATDFGLLFVLGLVLPFVGYGLGLIWGQRQSKTFATESVRTAKVCTLKWLARQTRVTTSAQADLMSRRPVKLLAVWVLVSLSLTFLLSLALPFPASLCMTLTAYDPDRLCAGLRPVAAGANRARPDLSRTFLRSKKCLITLCHSSQGHFPLPPRAWLLLRLP